MKKKKKTQLIIVLDESTHLEKGTGVGSSLCFWLAYVYSPSKDNHVTNIKISEDSRYEMAVLMKSANLKPVRGGAIYNDQDTPIKISLDGIARALGACSYLINKHSINEVIVCGDCEPAIDLASRKKQRRATSIIKICGTIDSSVSEYSSNGAPVSFRWVSEQDFSLYRDVDGICKQIRKLLEKN